MDGPPDGCRLTQPPGVAAVVIVSLRIGGVELREVGSDVGSPSASVAAVHGPQVRVALPAEPG
jgi:hypothetical protein